MKKSIITLALVVLILSSPIVSAAIIYDFESGSAPGCATRTTAEAFEGSWSAEVDDVCGSADFDIPNAQHTSVSYAFRMTTTDPAQTFIPRQIIETGDGNGAQIGQLRVNDNNEFVWFDGGTTVIANATADTWYQIFLDDIDYGANQLNVTIYFENGTVAGQERVDSNDPFSEIGNIQGGGPNAAGESSYYDFIRTNETVDTGEGTLETNLELDIRSWMPRDSTQAYEVFLNETNTTTGETTLTDVTADANVTIYNVTNTTGFSEPIATVNNSTDTIKSYNQTGLVKVNATYQGTTAGNGTNLTVGPRNLSNIGIMPPEQWPCSFLGCDENPTGGDNPFNIGSSMQMLWLIIFIMVAGTQLIENPWAGVGSGITTGILFWVMEFIDLGTMLTIVFAGILVGLIMARTSMGRGVTRDNEFSGAAGKDQK